MASTHISLCFLSLVLFLYNFQTLTLARNHISENNEYGASGIFVEKQFKFPFIANSGPSPQDFGHHAGYYKLPHSKSARMFYYFFESRNNQTDPVIIWLQGGPGCSGALPLFYENGPFHITNNLTLTWNDFGWDKVSNIIYVDQPTGTGFSYSSNDDDTRHNEEGVSNDLYDFLQAFFKEHPQYAKNDFYITGESYAGHYGPALATRVLQGNKNKEGVNINLKGLAIGNGLTNPQIQYRAYTDYALDMKLITQSDYKNLSELVSQCEQANKLCGADDEKTCVTAFMVCNTIFNKIVDLSGGKFSFDIRKKCAGGFCYNYSNLVNYMNLKSVRDALGVGDRNFLVCNPAVYVGMVPDWMKNLEVGIPAILEDRIKMFYFFFESRNNRSNEPVVVWLTGGPGCSGSLALFYENGPFHIANNLSLVWNNFGWDKVSNLIYVDQPIGTGFSYTSSKQDLRKSSESASVDFYDFLLAFFRKHPRLRKNDFYITGESYAGHYIPAFSARIHQANKNNKSTKINLKGMAIGNGLTNPEIQFKAYADYALNMKLINQSYYTDLNNLYPRCQKLIKLCENNDSSSCLDAFLFCISIYQRIVGEAGGINYYDIRKKCEGSLCYDFSNVEKFLNLKSVKKSLGVGNINFVSFSTEVYGAMATDVMKNYMNGIPSLLENGVKVLVYAGEYDLICNWLGNFRWVHAMKWVGQKKFGSAPLTPFIVDGVKIGVSKSHGPLTFLKVHNAGHLVPMDQPKASLEMIKRWMKWQPLKGR
ncbi:hypothetical protein ACJIZ3_011408 [Penstemon smallii]|uniref:Carboxypeptidase n=1 Tax=Penstemon smallii TaxID=265156 RepID=A0ABD3UL87_9LAMI